jgi:hypothetical protein
VVCISESSVEGEGCTRSRMEDVVDSATVLCPGPAMSRTQILPLARLHLRAGLPRAAGQKGSNERREVDGQTPGDLSVRFRRFERFERFERFRDSSDSSSDSRIPRCWKCWTVRRRRRTEVAHRSTTRALISHGVLCEVGAGPC